MTKNPIFKHEMKNILRKRLDSGSHDVTDRIPRNITITDWDLFLYSASITAYFIDLCLDINVARKYGLERPTELILTVIFIVLPAIVNTAISLYMYYQDEERNEVSKEHTEWRRRRVAFHVLQMASVSRTIDSLSYAWKSRKAESKGDPTLQRHYYGLMLKEDSDGALLRIFESFLEAAPQQVLQTTLLLMDYEDLALHQILSILSSVVSMGYCLASYQRAIRFAQEDKINMKWTWTTLQTIWHFLVTFSRVISIAVLAYLCPYWVTITACFTHILAMTVWILFLERPVFSQNPIIIGAFSLALGIVYLFTYILPVEGKTRCRYAFYYSLCFVQNVICSLIWCFYVNEEVKKSYYFYLVLVLCVGCFLLGIMILLVYYVIFHPKVGLLKQQPICEPTEQSEALALTEK